MFKLFQYVDLLNKYLKCSVWRLALRYDIYEGWNFNSGNYLFTTDTK